MNRCKNIIIILILLCASNCHAKKSVVESINEMVDTLTSLTCETISAENLLRGRFSHTCIKSDALSMAVAGVSSLGGSLSAMTITRMNDKDLFPENCSFENRADYTNPKINFAFCRNSKLAASYTIGPIISIITKVIPTLITNSKEAWNEAGKIFSIDKKDYHSIYNEPLGKTGSFVDVSVPFMWKVTKHNDQLCISALGLTGYSPIGCKFIKEPFPESIYSKFYGYKNDNKLKNIPEVDKLLTLTNSQSGSCYKKATDASKNLLPIVAPVVECAKQMVGKMALGRFAYDFNNSNKKDSITPKGDSILFKFQQNMRRAVMLLLTIYLIFVGFKILLKGEVPKKSELTLSLLKFILVIYFAVGINKEGEHFDGITEWLFPLLFNATSEFSNWISNAADNELCVFKPEYYKPSLGYMSTWDALDCRISHYLGLNNLNDLLLLAEKEQGIWDTFTNFSIPPYFLLIIPALLLGQVWLAILAIAFPLMVILVAAFVVNIFVISLIIISILAILGPIIIPMVLFDYTKSYFESWLRLMISFTFQPMVATIFMIVMFSMFDSSFYEGCLHKHKTTDSSFIRKDLHTFVLEVDKKEYLGKSNYDFKKCSHSLGFIINHFIDRFDEIKDIGFSDIEAILSNLLSGCIMLYLMYIILGNLTGFTADLSQSLNLSTMVLNAKKIMDSAFSTMSDSLKSQKGGKGKRQSSVKDEKDEAITDLVEQVVKRQNLIKSIEEKGVILPHLEKIAKKQGTVQNLKENTGAVKEQDPVKNLKKDASTTKKQDTVQNLKEETDPAKKQDTAQNPKNDADTRKQDTTRRVKTIEDFEDDEK